MKASRIFGIIFVVGIVAFVLYSNQSSQSPKEYTAAINHEREVKNTFMRTDKESPFAPSPDSFKGLNYFPPDLRFKVKAKLIAIDDKKMVTLPTSNGKEKSYLQYAYAQFDLEGLANRLLILEMTEPGPYRGTLMLAFADETSTHETYGAGRYMELKKIPGSSSIELDFNTAYNPYCAYSDKYSCPFPPPENILKVPIRAGEKSYH